MRIPLLTLLLIVFHAVGSNCLAQTALSNTTRFENEDVAINSSLIDCIDPAKGTAKQYVSLELINKTAVPISVSLKKEMWYDGTCLSCNSDSEEYILQVQIDANATFGGECNSNTDLLIFSKMLELPKVRQLSNFELKNIHVQK